MWEDESRHQQKVNQDGHGLISEEFLFLPVECEWDIERFTDVSSESCL